MIGGVVIGTNEDVLKVSQCQFACLRLLLQLCNSMLQLYIRCNCTYVGTAQPLQLHHSTAASLQLHHYCNCTSAELHRICVVGTHGLSVSENLD